MVFSIFKKKGGRGNDSSTSPTGIRKTKKTAKGAIKTAEDLTSPTAPRSFINTASSTCSSKSSSAQRNSGAFWRDESTASTTSKKEPHMTRSLDTTSLSHLLSSGHQPQRVSLSSNTGGNMTQSLDRMSLSQLLDSKQSQMNALPHSSFRSPPPKIQSHFFQQQQQKQRPPSSSASKPLSAALMLSAPSSSNSKSKKQGTAYHSTKSISNLVANINATSSSAIDNDATMPSDSKSKNQDSFWRKDQSATTSDSN